jgi:hypothetical protein
MDKGSSVAERLKHLEGLLTIVTEQRDPMSSLSINDGILRGGKSTNSAYTPTDNLSRGGSEAKDNTNIVHTGLGGHVDSSHWSSILENIKAIREELPSEGPQDKEQMSSSNSPEDASELHQRMSPDLDFGSSGGVTVESILAALPSRHVCDTLISMFFRWHYTMMRMLNAS